jgi:flavoprotein
MIIDFYECNKENLETVYAEYVKKVTENKGHVICTNILCVVKYTKPITYANEVIETDFKIITTPLCIEWCNGQNYIHKTPFVSFYTKNVDIKNVIKFAKMEDIVWE